MSTSRERSLWIPWVILCAATLLSWWLDAAISGAWVGTAILVVALFKARVVLMHFMGVQRAPAAVRWCCEVWVLLACLVLLGTYWFAPFTAT